VVQERAEDPKAPETSALYRSLRPVTVGSGRVGHKLAKRRKHYDICGIRQPPDSTFKFKNPIQKYYLLKK